MLKKLGDWTLSLAGRRSAEYWLAFIAFVESSVFLVPADVLFIPMSLINKEKTYRYAFIASLFSVLGGIAGWLIGHFAYEAIAKPVLEFYGKFETFEALRSNTSMEIILLLLITSGISHLPPIKVVTILAGVVGMNIWIFILSAIIARSARFYALAWLISRYGATVLEYLLPRLKWVIAIACTILIIAYIFYKILV
ncbi:YqaA family protein [Bartonella apis]|uniref:Membrane protein YqaA, SNARE-associated domain n=1 Tax=Bartonella apis TaxID=1686310 RepID=A0A1R0FAW9_9HYPH|nr:YqaA family protein [Bartonella apis]MCT6824587.1 DedA family protein [Bartonella apis]MCT6861614.1 DedA family protein [Bartonella apis]MCT6886706.1 DedA family protein [Bartonella apis]OLY44115.1 membrane protein YqaA, SNARE-associated domain [Bartonella apis]